MAIKAKEMIVDCKEGICPLCGNKYEYSGSREDDYDDGGYYSWKCSHCGASGQEDYIRRFDKHTDVCDEDGEDVEELTEQKENFCPVCGEELEYDGSRCDDYDDGGFYDWSCPGCGATGKEQFSRVFYGFNNVHDKAGNPIVIKDPSMDQ